MTLSTNGVPTAMKAILDSFKAFAKDGQTLEAEGNYKNDLQHGPQKSWHENGQIEFDCSFHYGETDGLFRQFDEEGQLVKEANFKKGEEI